MLSACVLDGLGSGRAVEHTSVPWSTQACPAPFSSECGCCPQVAGRELPLASGLQRGPPSSCFSHLVLPQLRCAS